MKIDLHTHSTFSDGTKSPTELIHEAIINEISILGLTDHDTISGWEEAKGALRNDLQLVLGAEISCLTSNGASIHMLGLLFDGTNQELAQALATSRDDRVPRLQKMIQLMANDGIDISYEEVLEAKPAGATLGRPHLADALVIKGIVKSRDEAFADLLNNSSKYYVAHMAPTPEAAIKLVRAAGGVAVIAHPCASNREIGIDEIQALAKAGLNGIEVDHRDQNPEERKRLREIAKVLGLAITGSSDYHGEGKLNLIGENSTALEEWEKLESMADARRVVRR